MKWALSKPARPRQGPPLLQKLIHLGTWRPVLTTCAPRPPMRNSHHLHGSRKEAESCQSEGTSSRAPRNLPRSTAASQGRRRTGGRLAIHTAPAIHSHTKNSRVRVASHGGGALGIFRLSLALLGCRGQAHIVMAPRCREAASHPDIRSRQNEKLPSVSSVRYLYRQPFSTQNWAQASMTP